MSRDINREKLDDLVRRINAVVRPSRIILFGSAARGTMHANSDVDVLVIVPSDVSTTDAEKAIYRSLWGFGLGVDVVAVTEDHVCRHADNPYLVIHTALSDGVELYRAAG